MFRIWFKNRDTNNIIKTGEIYSTRENAEIQADAYNDYAWPYNNYFVKEESIN